MHTNEPRQDPLTDLGYETRDVHYQPIKKIFFGFIIFTVGCLIFTFVYLNTGIHIGPIQIDGASAVYSGKQNLESDKRKIPGGLNPLVQSNLATRVEIQEMRQAEDARLNSYGYADEAKTKATIPIEDAINVVATGETISTGNVVAAESKGNTTDQRKDVVPGVTSDPKPKAADKATPKKDSVTP